MSNNIIPYFTEFISRSSEGVSTMPVVTLITADRLQECLQGDRRLRLYIILAIEIRLKEVKTKE